MKRKGQFLIISAVIAGLLVITLSTAISNIQNHEYQRDNLAEHINQLRDEAETVTEPSSPAGADINQEERRNFRKMTSYIEDYRTTVGFNDTINCVQVTLQSTERRIELPCMS